MRYVINKENGQRYYPFIFRRMNGGEMVEYPYVLAGNHIFWCGEDVDSLRFEFSVNGYSEIEGDVVSHEFQDLLIRVGEENDLLASSDEIVALELELLNRFAEEYMISDEQDVITNFFARTNEVIEQLSVSKFCIIPRVYGYFDGDFINKYFSSLAELREYDKETEAANPTDCVKAFVSLNGKGEWEERVFQELFDIHGEESSLQENPEGYARVKDFEWSMAMGCEKNKAIVTRLLNPELEIVKVPSRYKNAPVVKIGQNAFNIDVVATVTHVYSNDKVLFREVILPQTVIELDVGAFYGARYLEKITFSGEVTVIPKSCFAYCDSLKEIVIPEGIKQIQSMAFENCKSLEKIELPESLEFIDDYAFAGCESLKEIKLPRALVHIGNAFNEPIAIITDTYIEEIALFVENYECCSLEYKVLDDSLEQRRKLEEEARLEAARIEEERRLAEEEQARLEQAAAREAEINQYKNYLERIYAGIYKQEEKKTIYVKEKDSVEEILNALPKVYTGPIGVAFLDSVNNILKGIEDDGIKVLALESIVFIEESDNPEQMYEDTLGSDDVALSKEVEQALAGLKSFLASMPLVGEIPRYTISKSDDIDLILSELAQKLMKSPNMIQGMQITVYQNNPVIKNSRAGKIELLKIFAEVEVIEEVLEVDVIEEVAKAEAIEEALETEIAEEVAEVEAIEEVSETEEIEEVPETEAIEETSKAEIAEEAAEAEAIEEALETEIAEEVAEVEAIEEVSETEVIEKVPEKEEIEEISEVEEIEEVVEIRYRTLEDGSKALFCYASSNWTILKEEFIEDKIPVFIWNGYISFVSESKIKKVHFKDGTYSFKEVSENQAYIFNESIIQNIEDNQDFLLDDNTQYLVMNEILN